MWGYPCIWGYPGSDDTQKPKTINYCYKSDRRRKDLIEMALVKSNVLNTKVIFRIEILYVTNLNCQNARYELCI